jgi:hypothetical protein
MADRLAMQAYCVTGIWEWFVFNVANCTSNLGIEMGVVSHQPAVLLQRESRRNMFQALLRKVAIKDNK